MDREIFPGYRANHQRLVCIDSDGCMFDTMEIKHKECFCPATIQVWGLQPIAKYVREAWEFCNLYSKDRGRSRFHELILIFDLLAERDEVKQYRFTLPDITSFRNWVKTALVLNNAGLKEHPDDPVLARALAWSLESNRRIEEMVHGIPPFPNARESVQRLSGEADIAIVSATPREALEREWSEHGLLAHVHQLCAQEDGSKKECIGALKGYYPAGNVLMIGDALGDLEAAKANGSLFYPIRPNREIDSWRIFREEAMQRFLEGSYAGAYEAELIEAFQSGLSDVPPWKR